MESRTAARWALLLLAGCGSGSSPAAQLANEVFAVELDQQQAAFSIRDKLTGVVALGLHPAALLELRGKPFLDSSRKQAMLCQNESDPAAAQKLRCSTETQLGFTVELSLSIPVDDPHVLLVESRWVDKFDGQLGVQKLYPFRASSEEDGALLVGDDPRRVRVLQNGTDELLDFFVNILPGDRPLSNPDSNAILDGWSSYSNGSALAFDPASGASFLAGFTDFSWATPLVVMSRNATVAAIDGRKPMTELFGEARWAKPVTLAHGQAVSGGTVALIVGEPTPFDALEAYADQVAKKKSIHLPARPSSGWDSWYTQGARKEEISQAFIAANARFMSQRFAPFGLSSLQIDSGWQDQWGDWNARQPNFSDGLAASAARIEAQGLRSELWMAPLSASEQSATWIAHQADWFPPKGLFGNFLINSQMHPYDLSRPDVLDYVRTLGRRIHDWGFRSVKMDFAYFTLMEDLPPDPEKTAVALYKNAVSEFRSALGADTYFINIAMCFPNYGLVDALRIGLDTWPCWEGGTVCGPNYPAASAAAAQGVKPAVRMAARRYWMNGRIFWNHQDQVYIRDLSLEEARAMMGVMALSGGMVSLGEDSGSVSPEGADAFRRILPLTGLTARPLDLFEREFPELWQLKLSDGAQIVGVFHWGGNADLSTQPPTPRPDGVPETRSIDLRTLGLDPAREYVAYELWTGTRPAIDGGALRVELPPHASRIVKLIPKADHPQFLATDRHILMGPGFFDQPSWDAAALKLSGQLTVSSSSVAESVILWVPPGFTPTPARIEGGGMLTQTLRDELLVVTSSGAASGVHRFELGFTR